MPEYRVVEGGTSQSVGAVIECLSSGCSHRVGVWDERLPETERFELAKQMLDLHTCPSISGWPPRFGDLWVDIEGEYWVIGSHNQHPHALRLRLDHPGDMEMSMDHFARIAKCRVSRSAGYHSSQLTS